MSTMSKSQSRTKEGTKAALDSVSRGSIITMGVASAVAGLWAIACLASAMFGVGNPIELIKGWFSAVSGM